MLGRRLDLLENRDDDALEAVMAFKTHIGTVSVLKMRLCNHSQKPYMLAPWLTCLMVPATSQLTSHTAVLSVTRTFQSCPCLKAYALAIPAMGKPMSLIFS